ncbi:hypothetical protein QYF61_013406 [Mycteria americana]|uniref:C2H2-type domain-containing protein n=1 Tax=Mycteria americana TaxID=33587 RepID=A0AAN7MI88_MYCAM|nr:hypothetical protein QYF61_013406 [Mycteria americana]
MILKNTPRPKEEIPAEVKDAVTPLVWASGIPGRSKLVEPVKVVLKSGTKPDIQQPKEVVVMHCKAHQFGQTVVNVGNRLADKTAREAVEQSILALVPVKQRWAALGIAPPQVLRQSKSCQLVNKGVVGDHVKDHAKNQEERVVPIEVCRSKLSKYLQGVVFRCDKCTFTCSSDESLQQHIEKHNELKPYKCQLCYYETKHTEELDTHLRDEHKVSRNFELVGRVNLDQLEQMKGKTESSSSDEEEKELSHKTEERDSMMYPDSGAPEKRFPCEFCGRSFTEGSEWERHVLRHGMALNESKQGTREDSKLKENTEKTVNTLTVEEKESTEKMVVDLSHNSETTVSVVAADKPLQETSEAKNE